ncbi:unnamed protein product [Prorocentrum cordatum]|uniref:Protein S-acyltransferase n=1 Tax=Prorocentrum cordatum TaxID=2364126 RepID=A0ABN9R854_9DINO|nr:unnamed protein product [Polarella glacialis]
MHWVSRTFFVPTPLRYNYEELALQRAMRRADAAFGLATGLVYAWAVALPCAPDWSALPSGPPRPVVASAAPWAPALRWAAAVLALLPMWQHTVVLPTPTKGDNAFIVKRVFGGWVYLTRWTLFMQGLHHLATALEAVADERKATWIVLLTHEATVLLSLLGVFVSVQYFSLVRGHPLCRAEEQEVDRQRAALSGLADQLARPLRRAGPAGPARLEGPSPPRVCVPRGPRPACARHGAVLHALRLPASHQLHLTRAWPYSFMVNFGRSPVVWAQFVLGQVAVFLVIFLVIVVGACQLLPAAW